MGQPDLDELINHVEEQPQEIDKELQWMQEKTGFFSASELERLMSKTDTWTEANIKYLYEIQYQRRTGTFISAPANRNFKMGRERLSGFERTIARMSGTTTKTLTISCSTRLTSATDSLQTQTFSWEIKSKPS
jgi:hypothetical protein